MKVLFMNKFSKYFHPQIYYWLATAPESTAKQNITREQSILIRDLQIYTDYAVVVQAFNLAGDGPKSSVKYQKSKEDCKCQKHFMVTEQ